MRWDLVGVDEAHRLRGRSNKTHAVVGSLRRKRTLLLTATPVQTGLSDLLALLELIDPYLLSPLETTGLEVKEPEAALLEALKSRLQTVMIRNRRSDVALVGLHLPERSAQTLRFVLPPNEAALRQTVQTYTREIYQRQNRRGSFDLIALERRLASHPRSLEQGLRLRLEQRIGRVHRIGQTRPVQVYNLVAVGTIEERLVDILLGRINLFEGIIGELDAIMGVLEGTGWEAQVLELSLLEGGEAAQLSAVREADVERVSAQFQLAGELDPRSLERFDLSLRDRYLELQARQKEGLDHLPLRRYLRHAARALGLNLDADAELIRREGQPPLTLSPRLAADGEAELLHPMHPFVQGLLERTQLETPISRLNIEVSSSALVYPEALLDKRGLMLSLKVCWEGDAQDQLLVHLFVDTLGRVHTDLGQLYERSPWSEGHTLPWPGQPDLESAVQTALESLPVALQASQRKLERDARGRFETVARTLEHYFAEQMEGVERDLKFKLQQAINARIALHHAQDPDLRDLERTKLGTLERERDQALRETPDRLAALSSERDRKVNAERSRLKLERTVALVGVAVVQWV